MSVAAYLNGQRFHFRASKTGKIRNYHSRGSYPCNHDFSQSVKQKGVHLKEREKAKLSIEGSDAWQVASKHNR